MNDQKMIKKIFSLSRYDFINNFTNWISITGFHAVILSIIFCFLCYATQDYNISYWGWAPNIVLDLISKFYFLINSSSLVTIIVGALTISFILLTPLIIIQNSLDLAFDSSMQGLFIRNTHIGSYFAVIILSNILLLLFMKLLSYFTIFAMLYFMQTSYILNIFFIRFFVLATTFIIIYFKQMIYFLAMHVLEYKKDILLSCKEIYQMVSGKFLFLSKILLVQMLIVACALIALYVSLETFVSVIVPFILWFFDLFQLSVVATFVYMLYNFFYVWAYLLLYVWICLVIAHVYRQLACPPVGTMSCPTCKSCDK
ncbi:MAG: hypothetical protein JO129_01490 [Candidatus Dependentiae bacterium]|nr:hypothetical protein [Candidatus Dependentiae bacterium]